jgi:Xaa-Pro dipeptidase
MMRPAVIGQPSTQQHDDAARLIEFQDQQFAAMKSGALASDVDRILRDQVLEAGLRSDYDNVTGYTLGYYGSMLPARSSDFTRVFLPTSSWVLEPGMVFHMYAWGRGMSFSETVLVTETGHERLTKLERK